MFLLLVAKIASHWFSWYVLCQNVFTRFCPTAHPVLAIP